MTIRAVVPLKKLGQAKSRLAGALLPDERKALVLRMAAHVVAVLKQTVDEITMLTGEPLAGFAGLPQIIDTEDGLNANLDRAVQLCRHRPGDLLIVLFPDLPLLAPADVHALIKASAHGMAMATDHLKTGTNAIALRAPGEFRFQFGPGSRLRHQAEAVRLGLQAHIIERAGLACDVDDFTMLHLCKSEESSFL